MRFGGLAQFGAAVAAALLIGAPAAHADAELLIGTWACVGQSPGTRHESEFDYLADGRYISRQRIILDADNFIVGGGGGNWRLEGEVLFDTKTDGRLDRFVRAGQDVPPSDPQFQRLVAGARSNIGATTQGQLSFDGPDRLSVGMMTCERQHD